MESKEEGTNTKFTTKSKQAGTNDKSSEINIVVCMIQFWRQRIVQDNMLSPGQLN